MKNGREKIAIIGMSCHFPKSNDINIFWKNLQEGADCISHFDASQESSEKTINARGVLDKIEYFDFEYFGISQKEASIMDPQHRIFLEKCVEALEDAGCDLARYDGRIGVFASAADSSYLHNNLLSNEDFKKDQFPYRTKVLNGSGFLATRVSYLLNLNGPSININTACSSSLVSIIYACKALENNECDLVLSGGVTIQCPQEQTTVYHAGGILSPDGVCRPFDKEAAGTVSSNGVGVVVMKRLSDAVVEQDNILAVVSGFHINNDGSSKVSYSAPSVEQQSTCIKAAMDHANVESKQISYIETHGTATPLGDTIEIEALKEIFSTETEKKYPCALGAVKSNIGHTDMASGVAGVIKTVLSLVHQKLVPTIHHTVANAMLNLDNSPFCVNKELKPWTLHSHQTKRIAGVNSLGIGGTNAHIILEEFLTEKTDVSKQPYCVVPISARSEKSFTQYNYYLNEKLADQSINLADLAFTLASGRKTHAIRRAYLCKNLSDLSEQLSQAPEFCRYETTPRVAFILEGSHVRRFAKPMIDFFVQKCEFFNRHVHHCHQYVHTQLANNWQQYPLLAYFIIEYAYTNMLLDFGVKPRILIVDEWGEYVAYVLAGKLSLEEAITTLCHYILTHNTDKAQGHSIQLLLNNCTLSDKATIPIFSTRSASDTSLLQTLIQESAARKINCFIALQIDNNLFETLKNDENYRKSLMITWPNKQSSNNEDNLWHGFLNTLGQCWERGIDISWEHYYKNEKRQKISLPPTVFERKKAWIEASKEIVKLPFTVKETICHFGIPYWELLMNNEEIDLSTPKCWLIFSGNDSLSQHFISLLKAHHQTVVVLTKNKSIFSKKKNHFNFDPGVQAQCEAANDFILNQVSHIDHVLYFWSFDSVERNDFIVIKNLVLHVLSDLPCIKLPIYFFTRSSMRVEKNDKIKAENALLQGMSLVLEQEFNIRSVVVDIETRENCSRAMADNILKKCIGAIDNKKLAYRSGMLFTQRVKPWIANHSDDIVIQKKCKIFITGGLGKIGLSIAEYFATHYNADILLLAHSSKSNLKSACLYSLMQCRQEFTQPVLEYLDRIQMNANSLSIAYGDVASYNDIQAIAQQFIQVHSSFDYVLHCAAYLKEDAKHPISEINATKLDSQMKPKLTGCQNLHRLSQKCPIGCIVVFSSISSVLGGLTMATYASTNAVVDAYFQSIQNEAETDWLCLNWDAWSFKLSEKKQKSLTAEQGIHCLIEILTCRNKKHLQLLISGQDIMEYFVETETRIEQQLANYNQDREKLSQNLSDMKSSIRNIFQHCLGVNQFHDDDDFYDLGGDSLSGVELIDQIKKQLSLTLPHSFIFQNRTVNEICEAVQKKHFHKNQTIYPLNQSKGPIVFLLHPISGMNSCYNDLVRHLATEYTFYVINDPEIEAKQTMFNTLDQMVDYYLKLIKTIQPTGDYILIGYSFGGSIAHILTQRLEAEGNQNTKLFIVDSWAVFSDDLRSYERFQTAMKRHITNILGRVTEHTLEKMLIDLLWHRMQLLFKYQLPKIDSDIILLKAKKLLNEYRPINQTFNHWNHYTNGQIKVFQLPYTHETILNTNASKVFAKIIRNTLKVLDVSVEIETSGEST